MRLPWKRDNVAFTPTTNPQATTDTVVISDLHLRYLITYCDELLGALQQVRFRRLVILGDLLDDSWVGWLRRDDRRFIDYVRQLRQQGVIVEIVTGNHDHHLVTFMKRHFANIGIRLHRRGQMLEDWVGGRRFLLAHGDQFCPYLDSPAGRLHDYKWDVVIASFLMRLYEKIYWWPNQPPLPARWKRLWHRAADVVDQRAIDEARHRRADVVICGHTHRFCWKPQASQPSYVNLGSWTALPARMLLIAPNGKLDVWHVDKNRITPESLLPKIM